MNKEDIFNEFINSKKKKDEKNNVAEEVKEVETSNDAEIEEYIEPLEEVESAEEEQQKAESAIDEISKEISNYNSPEFLKFKEEFMKEENVETFFYMLDSNRKRGIDVFDNDFYIYQKMLDPKIKVVIIEPTEDDIIQGKGGQFFLVKPIYSKEYNQFVKEYGNRMSYPEEYKDFTILKGVLYPKLSKKDIDIMTGGVANSLYQTINNISNFNTVYRIMEI